ncbi:unnamed protein product, partial [Staurois parvus]
MALGREGLTCGAIKGLTVCCCVYVLHCKHTAFHGCAMRCAMRSRAKQCARAD